MTVLLPQNVIWIVVAALTWGITNPLLKKTSLESTTTNTDKSILSHLYSLITAWKFCLTQLVNWCGTIFFLKALSSADLTIVVPVTNGLTFVITHIVDSLLFNSSTTREEKRGGGHRVYLGVVLVCIGTMICMQK